MTASGTPVTGPGELVVDRLRWWDLDQVLTLEGQLFGPTAWTPGQFWSELAHVPQTRWYLAARRGPRVVGYAGVFLAGTQADLQTVGVAPEEQGRGTGRRLVQTLLGRAAGAGASVLHLEVAADNERAISLYRRLGFAVDGRRRDYYGPGRDALLMSLRLGAAAAQTSSRRGGHDG